jgi:hypothetical protein
MEAMTLLLLTVVVIAACFLLFLRDPKKARFLQLTKAMSGPTAYPVVGTALPFMFAARHSEYRT